MRLVIQKAAQLPAPRRVLQLAQRFRFDLADALAGHRELLADFFQRVVPRSCRCRSACASTRISRGVNVREAEIRSARRGLRLGRGRLARDELFERDQVQERLFVCLQ